MASTSRYTKTPIFKNENKKRSYETSGPIVIKKRDDDILLRWTDNTNARKLAFEYLGSPEYFWVILSTNNVSLEKDLVIGQQIRIPRHIGTITAGI